MRNFLILTSSYDLSDKAKSFQMVDPTRAKIISSTPTPLELQVAQSLVDLENSVAELKADLAQVQISAVKEVRFREVI